LDDSQYTFKSPGSAKSALKKTGPGRRTGGAPLPGRGRRGCLAPSAVPQAPHQPTGVNLPDGSSGRTRLRFARPSSLPSWRQRGRSKEGRETERARGMGLVGSTPPAERSHVYPAARPLTLPPVDRRADRHVQQGHPRFFRRTYVAVDVPPILRRDSSLLRTQGLRCGKRDAEDCPSSRSTEQQHGAAPDRLRPSASHAFPPSTSFSVPSLPTARRDPRAGPSTISLS